MTRRELLLRAAAVLALPAARLITVPSAHAKSRVKVASWSHSLKMLEQNAIGSKHGAMHMRWDLPHKDFTIDLCYEILEVAPGTKGSRGWLVYREKDAKNFYQCGFRTNEIAIVKRVGGRFIDMQTIKHDVKLGEEHMIRITVIGDHHRVWMLNKDGSRGAQILDHHDSTYMHGFSFSYYTEPGVHARWEEAKGKPL